MEAGNPGDDRLKRPNGAVRIFFYNWPVYVGTWALALVVLLIAVIRPRFAPVAVVLGAFPIAWSIVSLLVSFYIYDRSRLVEGRWISQLLPALVHSWAAIHAGLDAEVELDSVMPGQCLARLDLHDVIIDLLVNAVGVNAKVIFLSASNLGIDLPNNKRNGFVRSIFE